MTAPWVYNGEWDGRRVQDLPAIMCSVMAQINKRWEVLGLSGWVTGYTAPSWIDKNGDALAPGVLPVAADYDGMRISSPVSQALYAACKAQAEALTTGMLYSPTVVAGGTASCVHDSSTVTGTGTAWTADVIGGVFKRSGDATAYTVTDCADTTHITISPAWSAVTSSGGYTITGPKWTQFTAETSSPNPPNPPIVSFGARRSWNYTQVTADAPSTADVTYPETMTFAYPWRAEWPDSVLPDLPASTTYKGPAGAGIDPWLALRDYLDLLTVVRFAWTDGNIVNGPNRSMNAFNTGDAHMPPGVDPDAKYTVLDSYSNDCLIAAWKGNAQPAPSWDAASELTDIASEYDSAQALSKIGWDAKHYNTINGIPWYRAGINLKSSILADSDQEMITSALGVNARSTVRVRTIADTAFAYDIKINDVGFGTQDTGTTIIELVPDDGITFQNNFALAWDAADIPVDPPITISHGGTEGGAGTLYACFCVWRDMTEDL